MINRKSKGLLKVFISSTFRDLQAERQQLYEKLSESISPVGMEFFIPDGKTSHEISLLDEDQGLKNSDIVIFLISPYYGSLIEKCNIPTCKADCPLKNGTKQKISYTHCEFKFAKAENKPFLIYRFDAESWDLLQPLYQMEKIDWDSNNPIFKLKTVEEIKKLHAAKDYIIDFKNEIGSIFGPNLNSESISLISEHLAENIVKWYYEGRIAFQEFYGRKTELKQLIERMNESIEVYGVGGIGKTTLIHVALLIQMLKGRKILAIGKKQSYLSGSGYNLFKEKCPNVMYEITTDRITLNDIIDALKFREVHKIEGLNDKIQLILSKITTDKYLIFIDDFHLADQTVRQLVKESNNFIISAKKKSGITRNEVPLLGINDPERSALIKLISQRFGKNLKPQDIQRISDFSEGHPITMEILIRNIEIINFEKLNDYKKDVLDFSNSEQVEEFINRVIEGILSREAFTLLKNIAMINTVIESNISLYVVEKAFRDPPSAKYFVELINSGILTKKGNEEGSYLFTFKHIQDAVREDTEQYNKSALSYYESKRIWLKKFTIDDEIERFSHQIKSRSSINYLKTFNRLASKVSPINFGYKKLIEIGLSLKERTTIDDEKATLCNNIGILVGDLNHYRDAKDLYKEAIDIYRRLSERNRESYTSNLTTALNCLGNLYLNINKLDQAKECYENALKLLKGLNNKTINSELGQISSILTNLGIVYSSINRPYDAKNSFLEALRIQRIMAKKNPMGHLPTISKIIMNLGNLSSFLNDYADALKKYKEGVKTAKTLAKNNPAQYLILYGLSLNSIGSLYDRLHNDKKVEEYFTLSVNILKDLSEKNPDAYLPDYVQILTNFANYYLKSNDIVKATNYAETALNQAKILAKRCPVAYNPLLAQILIVYGDLFSQLNRPDHASQFYNESLVLLLELNQQSPGAYVNNISSVLLQLGTTYEQLNKYSDSQTTLDECLNLRTKLVTLCHDAYLDDYNDVLLAQICYKEKQKDFSYVESLKICEDYARELHSKCPQAFKLKLVNILQIKGRLYAVQHNPHYNIIFNECLQHADDLIKISPNSFTPYYGALNSCIGYCHMINNNFVEAEKYLTRSLSILKVGYMNYPDVFSIDYSDALNNFGLYYLIRNLPDEAEKYLQEALQIREDWTKKCAISYSADYSNSLNNMGYCKLLQQLSNDAEIYLTRSLNIQKELILTNRNIFSEEYARLKRNLGKLYLVKNNYPESKIHFEESIKIQKEYTEKYPDIFKIDYRETLIAYSELLSKMGISDELSKVTKLIEEC
ncbi:tetratricopeptide repeat protein [Methanoregula boonei]|nr:tetratricopeptide repeat protein [Methanoregula boonei]